MQPNVFLQLCFGYSFYFDSKILRVQSLQRNHTDAFSRYIYWFNRFVLLCCLTIFNPFIGIGNVFPKYVDGCCLWSFNCFVKFNFYFVNGQAALKVDLLLRSASMKTGGAILTTIIAPLFSCWISLY